MGEKTYITKYGEILQRVRGLEITDVSRKETPCNLDDVIITLSDGSELHITDHHELRVVHHSFE